ncbi:2-oxoglutarate dehydrogenase E1 component [Alkalibacillus almallahensis]|nr:2-oxoglutarate dehydrogenase E1 component [Alkalibacillus almallahensis]
MAIQGSNGNVWHAFHGPNMGYVEEQYELFLDDPDAVDESLRQMFEQYGAPDWMESSNVQTSSGGQSSINDLKKLTSAMKLVDAIRRHGHLEADIFPVGKQDDRATPLVDPKTYDLTEADLKQMDAKVLIANVPSHVNTAWDLIQHLRSRYSGTASFEFNHIPDDDEREWLYNHVENGAIDVSLSDDYKKDLLKQLAEVEGFEQFLGKTFVGQKRFSIEGIDVMVPMIDRLVKNGNQDSVEHILMGMAHRGRLNVLAHILGKPYEKIFSEFAHSPDKELVPSEGSTGINYGWTGDVKYHFGADREYGDENSTKVTLAHNPSHLEFVNPVVEGYTRAVQDNRHEAGYAEPNFDKAFTIQIHGDAAFIGEGVVAETLNMSQLDGYETGGSIHIIANNLLGFTTNHKDGRSPKYASDLAKGFEMPIVHVNADDPEACMSAIELAYQYRKKFQKDVIIDLVGYRRFGHNEMDEPRGTQPNLYREIDNQKTAYELYAETLTNEQIIGEEDAKAYKDQVLDSLRETYNSMKENEDVEHTIPDIPEEVVNGLDKIETAVDESTLKKLNEDMLKRPEGFNGFKKLEKILQRREKAFEEGEKVDWALGEALAYASILNDGTPIRMTGQDTQRGTFAHRHAVLHDTEKQETYSPFHGLEDVNRAFSIYNSPLNETGVLGFEYGYSVQSDETLVLWEAQFGDFANAAQVIFDQFIASGRAKWGQIASLVMLLPHGYEGQGPEHSSARLERFLQLSAENNWTVANVTSAGQFFHLLRRQAAIVGTEAARPLVVMSPKSLLRNQRVAVDHEELSEGKFKHILEQHNTGEDPEAVKRLVLGSGKVMVELEEAMEKRDPSDAIHLARIEQIYPFPEKELQELLKKYKNVEEIIWLQEEPKNMGSWDFVKERIQDIKKVKQKLHYVGRPHRSSPAVGDPNVSKAEQSRILNEALKLD